MTTGRPRPRPGDPHQGPSLASPRSHQGAAPRNAWKASANSPLRRRSRIGPAHPGKEADEEVGLTYFGERYLVQRIGRWATPDPLWIHAEGGGEALNAFRYISGNLLQGRDPSGLEDRGVIARTVDFIVGRAIQRGYEAASVVTGNPLPKNLMNTFWADERTPVNKCGGDDGTFVLSKEQTDEVVATTAVQSVKDSQERLVKHAFTKAMSGQKSLSADGDVANTNAWAANILDRLRQQANDTGKPVSESISTRDALSAGAQFFQTSVDQSIPAFLSLGGAELSLEGSVTYTPASEGSPEAIQLFLSPVVTDRFDFHGPESKGTGPWDHVLNRLQGNRPSWLICAGS